MMPNVPENVRKLAAENTERVAAMNQRVLDWQVEQAKIAEKQIVGAVANTRASVEATVKTLAASQQAWLDAMTPDAE